MKNLKYYKTKALVFMVMVFTIASCERDLSDEAVLATFGKNGEIFTDSPVGMGTNFYFPFSGSKATAWTVDEDEGYESKASMRFDVPNANDPDGNFAGAIFRVDGAGRNLSEFDALTFWAKASQGVTIGEIGFGQDFLENTYQVTRTNLTLGTTWTKYIIPIPDPSKLTEERGMLWYSAGSQGTGGFAYTFWLDEVKFEKLGTVAQSRPAILNGEDVDQRAFLDVPIQITGLSQTFSTPSGDVNVLTTPSYYNFESSDTNVATVDQAGLVSVLSTGNASISASIASVKASGSLNLDVTGPFDFAPLPPTRDSADVISVFSNAYTNVPTDYYNGFFAPFQTTEGGAPPLDVNGDGIINYTSLNFVAIGTFADVPALDVSSMTHLHIDIKVNEAIEPNDFINIQLINSVGNNETSGTVGFPAATFTQDQWVGLDIPLTDFGLTDLTQIGLLFFITDATISDIFVDNIYYYR